MINKTITTETEIYNKITAFFSKVFSFTENKLSQFSILFGFEKINLQIIITTNDPAT